MSSIVDTYTNCKIDKNNKQLHLSDKHSYSTKIALQCCFSRNHGVLSGFKLRVRPDFHGVFMCLVAKRIKFIHKTKYSK